MSFVSAGEMIIRALAPLHPTTTEIEEIIATFKQHGAGFAKFIRVDTFQTVDRGIGPTTPMSTQPLTPK